MLDTANNLNMVMVPTGRPSDPCEEVVTISSNSAEHRSHAYGTCAKNGGQPRVRRSIGNQYYNFICNSISSLHPFNCPFIFFYLTFISIRDESKSTNCF